MRLVDTFPFAEPHEADVLWVKLSVEEPLIDEWVVVENSYTHQGQYKGYFFNDLIARDARFSRFVSKLHVIECDIKPSFEVDGRKVFDSDAIQMDRAQRAAALPYLLNKYADPDYVLISDVDECLDMTAARRRRLLRRKLDKGEDIILVPRIRYWFDFDNRALGRRCVPLVSIRQLRRDGGINEYRERWLGEPAIWRHEMVFEYSYCFSRDGITRKYETFIHTGFEQDEIDAALRCNFRPISKHRPRSLEWTHEQWFVKRRLNSRNSPAFVREHLSELKTNVLSADYRKNRREAFPQYFPRSRVRRARRWVVLYGGMYAYLLEHNSRAYRRVIKKLKPLGRRDATKRG
jgi:hypothetical protein